MEYKRIENLIDYCLDAFDNKKITKELILHRVLKDFKHFQYFELRKKKFANAEIDH